MDDSPLGLYGGRSTRVRSDCFYKTSRFTLASETRVVHVPGSITLSPGRYAVWAELIDRATYKRIIFVERAHLVRDSVSTRSAAGRSTTCSRG